MENALGLAVLVSQSNDEISDGDVPVTREITRDVTETVDHDLRGKNMHVTSQSRASDHTVVASGGNSNGNVEQKISPDVGTDVENAIANGQSNMVTPDTALPAVPLSRPHHQSQASRDHTYTHHSVTDMTMSGLITPQQTMLGMQATPEPIASESEHTHKLHQSSQISSSMFGSMGPMGSKMAAMANMSGMSWQDVQQFMQVWQVMQQMQGGSGMQGGMAGIQGMQGMHGMSGMGGMHGGYSQQFPYGMHAMGVMGMNNMSQSNMHMNHSIASSPRGQGITDPRGSHISYQSTSQFQGVQDVQQVQGYQGPRLMANANSMNNSDIHNINNDDMISVPDHEQASRMSKATSFESRNTVDTGVSQNTPNGNANTNGVVNGNGNADGQAVEMVTLPVVEHFASEQTASLTNDEENHSGAVTMENKDEKEVQYE